jgi:hypothetical protein
MEMFYDEERGCLLNKNVDCPKYIPNPDYEPEKDRIGSELKAVFPDNCPLKNNSVIVKTSGGV